MIAHITAPVELIDLAVFAELATWGPRPALAALCRAAAAEGTLDEDAIDRVLPGLPKRGRLNLARHLRRQRLLARDGSPTALGRRCAASGEAPMWEQGVYHFLVARHPLIGCQVLAFRRAGVDPRDRDFDGLESLPQDIAIDPDRVFTSVFDEAVRFGVCDLPQVDGQPVMCKLRQLLAAELRWQIDPLSGENTWHIHGEVRGGSGPRTFTSAAGGLDPARLAGIIEDWDPDWDRARGWLVMPFDGERGFDRETRFLRDYTYARVEIPGHGTFDEVSIVGIPVGPGSADDARHWAAALAAADLRETPRHLSTSAWKQIWASVIEDSPLSTLAGEAPTADEMEAVSHPPDARTQWLLRAAEDLEVAV